MSIENKAIAVGLAAGDIVTRIKALKGRALKVQEEIHILAVACLVHIRDHGNTTLMLNLVQDLPKSIRREGLAYWVNKFSNGKVSVNVKKDGCTIKLDKKRTAEDFDIDGAWETPFWDASKEKKPGESLTVEKLVAWLKKRANEDGEFDDGTPKVSEEARDLAAALVAHVDELTKPKLQIAA